MAVIRRAKPELFPVDGVIVLPEPPAGLPHRAGRPIESGHHALHAHVTEIVVRHLDNVLARCIVRVLEDVPVADRGQDGGWNYQGRTNTSYGSMTAAGICAVEPCDVERNGARVRSVITSAGSIMIAVFAAFAMGSFLPVQMLGFVLTVAVLLDATVVRMVIGPALLRLAGQWNWWPGENPRRRRRSAERQS